MEDLKVTHDYSVRGSSGAIIQFVYGNDGMDATFVESQPLYITKLSLEDIVDKYYFSDKTDWNKLLHKDVRTTKKDMKPSLTL